MPKYSFSVNGNSVDAEVDADTPLLWVLRDQLNLLGTKFGCGVAQCGACTVHVNGEAMRSCVLPISALGSGKVVTIEGLSPDGKHPLQLAWQEVDVAQCGYCQAGQIMSAAVLLKQNPDPSIQDIDNAMSGNICRCGTYIRIRKAIQLAAKKNKTKSS